MTKAVLVIDGPLRGKMYTTELHRFLYADTGWLKSTVEDTETAIIPERIYYVHKIYMFGRIIRVASTKLLTEEIRPEDVFEAIASDKAKEAAG